MIAVTDTQLVDLNELRPYPENARVHDDDLLVESVSLHGQYRALVVQRSTGMVLAGNGTYAALLANGFEQALVHYIDCDDVEAKRINLIDNRSNDRATYDDGLLAALLRSLEDPTLGTGWEQADIDALFAKLAPPVEGKTDPDDVPALPPVPYSKPGDLWRCGDHRVLVGDSTNPNDVAKLFYDSPQAVMMFTDPPYGVEIVGGSHALPPEKRRKAGEHVIQNDGVDDVEPLIRMMFEAAKPACVAGAPVYLTGPSHSPQVHAFLKGMGDIHHQTLVWVKDSLVLTRYDYHNRHEAIFYGWMPGAAHRWYGNRSQDTVWEIDRPKRSDQHPTMKPVALVEKALHNSSTAGDIIYDPFAGSGTTLIAATMLHRVTRCIEIDPKYVDVILRRWQEFTEELPTLDGEPHDFVADPHE